MLRNRPIVSSASTGMHQADRNAEMNQKPSFQPGTYVYERDAAGNVVGRLRCGRLLGRGGFAKCYEVFDSTGSYALKAINRASLDKPKTLQKLHSEIAIHSRMKHKNVVNFMRTFKDRYYVYILLEKCDNGTLMDMLKIRPLTVAETQFIMLQCLTAMQYMHDESVIHRDLKPGNIMLDSEINVKIGDFGLAAELQYDGERKRTICGTPNYIAPEIIDRKSHGHSFEVDTWSLGVILYTLLVGQPPFQMEDVESTYSRIRACRYDFPPSVPTSGRDLIQQILQSSPVHRPTILDIRRHPFFCTPTPPMSPPASLTAFGLRFPQMYERDRPRRASAPIHNMQHQMADPRPLPRDANANKGGGGYMQPGATREMLRPISANVPSCGAPTSPRAVTAAMYKRPVVSNSPVPATANNNFIETRPLYPRASTAATAGAMPPPMPTYRRQAAVDSNRQQSDRPPVSVSDGMRRSAAGGLGGDAQPVAVPALDARSHTPPDSKRAQDPPAESAHHYNNNNNNNVHNDDDEDRRQLTTLHDRLHQTLCAGDDENEEEAVINGNKKNSNRHNNNNLDPQMHRVSTPHTPLSDNEEYPAPTIWVTECADFSTKYGLCYRLSSGHTGAHFNDSTKMVWEPITGRVEYYARVRVELPQRNGEVGLYAKDELEAFNMSAHPQTLDKKVTLIKYFKSYLGRSRNAKDKVEVVRCTQFETSSPPRLSEPHVAEDFVYVKRWLRTPEALVFRLSNKTVQVCFNDRAEVILSSEWKVVTYTDAAGVRRTLPLSSIASESEEAASRLRYTKSILYQLIKDHCL